MRVLIACEESQAVCIEMRRMGHEAFSCDLLDCSGGHPEWHIKDDVLNVIEREHWDMMIAFPPCTYLSSAGLFWLNKKPGRRKQLEDGRDFFLKLYNAKIDKICIENPVGWMNTHWQKPTQIIEPYYFGDNDRKRTCLWLKGLPKLKHFKQTDLFDKKTHVPIPKPYQTLINKNGIKINVYFANQIKDIGSSISRSKTFPGIAKAMAEQWGKITLDIEQ